MPHKFFLMLFFIYFSGKKRALATTNADDEDLDTERYVWMSVERSHLSQSAFSPEYMTPKKVHTKEPSTPSMSIKSAFVYFLY